MYKVISYQAAKAIDIKNSKLMIPYKLIFFDSDELFYQVSSDKYIYVFEYGMVSFFNFDSGDIDEFFRKLQPFCKGYFFDKLNEEISVNIITNELQVKFEGIVIPDLNFEMIRLIMLNTSQSVALNRYSEITEALLEETNVHTQLLENKGKLNISGVKLKQFIGRILNIKNTISENLYIFDSPDITWDNEQLNKLNKDLKQNLDLKDRYRRIYERIQIIKENLELFKDILEHIESSKLEWIIIILIFVEVIDMFILKFI